MSIDEEFAKSHIDFVPGNYVVLTVRDSGCGMTEEVKSHLFEPFYTTKEPGKGTGLGLSTTYGIIRQHHGAIELKSEQGKGTTFRIYLPHHGEKEEITDRGDQEKTLPGGSETVLVVEDAQSVRQIEVKMLNRLGYHVLEARDGDDALRVSKEFSGPIDILLSDVILPIISGYDLFRRLKETRPEIKALFVSGYIDERFQRIQAVEGGIVSLQKPFTTEALAQKIRKALL